MHRWPSPKARKQLRDSLPEITDRRNSGKDVKQRPQAPTRLNSGRSGGMLPPGRKLILEIPVHKNSEPGKDFPTVLIAPSHEQEQSAYWKASNDRMAASSPRDGSTGLDWGKGGRGSSDDCLSIRRE